MQYAIVTRKFSFDPRSLQDFFGVRLSLPHDSIRSRHRGPGAIETELYCRVYKHLRNGKVSVETVCGEFACDIDPIDMVIVSEDSIPQELIKKYINPALDDLQI